MKPGAIVLNVARGGHPRRGGGRRRRWPRVSSAGPGSTSSRHEPPTGSPLLDAPNTLLTPHLGASTAEAQVLVAEEVADQVLDVLAGRIGALRGQRPAADAGDGAGDRAVPAAGRDARPVLRPVRPRRASGRVTLEIAGELAAHDASPLTAAVLRGMLETSTTRARQPRQRRRRSPRPAASRSSSARRPTPAAYAAQITLSSESGGRPTTVAGTVAGGELRLTRLDDYRLDMAPTDVMLITRHRDRPGTIGRIGQILGEADVNISAMHVARQRAAGRRADGPGPRRRRRAATSPRRSATHDGGDRAVDDPARAGPLTGGPPPRDGPRRAATRPS